jgi:hypothetical protein
MYLLPLETSAIQICRSCLYRQPCATSSRTELSGSAREVLRSTSQSLDAIASQERQLLPGSQVCESADCGPQGLGGDHAAKHQASDVLVDVFQQSSSLDVSPVSLGHDGLKRLAGPRRV